MKLTLYDKIWNDHIIRELDDGTSLVFVDRHLAYEVTSPLAFESLRSRQIKVMYPELSLAVADHNIPTTDRTLPISDKGSALQIETLYANANEFGINYFSEFDPRQGIVHVIGPEQGFTLPGMTIVCGDSHTATHGAFGSLAYGIGSSEVEQVLATQTVTQKKSKSMRIIVDGKLGFGCSAKDLALAIIGKVGASGGTGFVIEYAGEVIRSLSMEGRMTLCNMAIEGGAKAGLIAPDEKTFAYVKGRPLAPKQEYWGRAVDAWSNLHSDRGAQFDREIKIFGEDIAPQVTWGTSPEDVLPVTGFVPHLDDYVDANKKESVARSLAYMGLESGTALTDIKIDTVFIGSCTNSRIEDLRSAAKVLQGKKIAGWVTGLVVPGSGLVKRQAESEGLDDIFRSAGLSWREPGCSMCLGMNPDRLSPGERCASTSNRNFEGRQGFKGRTHLMSPAMAAAAAVKGQIADVREFV